MIDLNTFLFKNRSVDYCSKCFKVKRDALNHVCRHEYFCFKCLCCHRKIKFHKKKKTICPICHVYFFDEICLKNHYLKIQQYGIEKERLSACQIFFYCENCESIVRRFQITNFMKRKKKIHNCGKIYCHTCLDSKPKNHYCYIPMKNKRNEIMYTNNMKNNYVYVFDFETESKPNNDGIFIPYYCVVHKFCNLCMDKEEKKSECCKDEWYYFEGENTLVEFGDFFLERSGRVVKSKWYAHNGSKFDSLFLLRFLVCSKSLEPNVIMNGYRIIQLIYKNSTVQDSMLLTGTSLKNTIKMLGLSDYFSKGFFPYQMTDLDYVGVIPSKSMFELTNLNVEEMINFNSWYEEKSQHEYVLRNEVKNYCRNDVEVLSKCLVKFHNIIFEYTGVEVLFDSSIMTASSLSLNIFMKTNDMRNKLSNEPPYGYSAFCKSGKAQSEIALKWLAKKRSEVENPEEFRWKYHVLGEFKIGKYYVDGYDPHSKTVYEFNGCFYHGCEDCFFPEAMHIKLSKSYGKLNSETESRLNYIRMHVSQVVVMKDCEVNVDELSCVSVDVPLRIRDAMYGGRTSSAVLYKDCESGGKIHYVDFNSLYPSVQYENEFPIGHPKIVTGDYEIKNYFKRNEAFQ